ncbi:MAG: glycosyltransferase family 9 protein [bacterium]
MRRIPRERFLERMRADSAGAILVIKPGAIGDVLHMTPVVKAIKRHLPDARAIFLVGGEPAMDLLAHNPNVYSVVVFKKGRGLPETGRIIRLARSLQRENIDWILNYQPSNWRWRLLTLLLRPKGTSLYRKQRRISGGTRVVHAVEDHCKPLQKLGIEAEDLTLDLVLTGDEQAAAEGVLAAHTGGDSAKGTVCLNMGASHPVNRWPVHFFYQLHILLDMEGFRTVLVGGEEDRVLAEEFLSIGPARVLNLVGSLSIRMSAAVLNRCDILVSGDTGPLHLATAVGTRVIGLFGAADPRRTGPIGRGHVVVQPDLPCVPCRKRRCPMGRRVCMEAIAPEDVVSRILSSMKGQGDTGGKG